MCREALLGDVERFGIKRCKTRWFLEMIFLLLLEPSL